MSDIWQAFQEFPFLIRAWLGGGFICGVVGGVAGLIIGLNAYPPTAWFAVLEVGAPAAILGSWLSLVVALMITIVRRANTRRAARRPR